MVNKTYVNIETINEIAIFSNDIFIIPVRNLVLREGMNNFRNFAKFMKHIFISLYRNMLLSILFEKPPVYIFVTCEFIFKEQIYEIR